MRSILPAEPQRSDKEKGNLGETGTDGGGWMQPAKLAHRRSPSRPSSSDEGGDTGSPFGPLLEGGPMDRVVLLEPNHLASRLGSLGQSSVASLVHIRGPGRGKWALPTSKQPGLGGKDLTPFKPVPIGKGLSLEGEDMEVASELGNPVPRGANLKGKAPMGMARKKQGKFVFSVGGPGAGASCPPIDLDQGLALMGEMKGPTHEEAVDRLRQIIENDGKGSVVMADTMERVAMELDGGCHGVDPPPHHEP